MRFTLITIICITILFSCQHALEKPKDLLSKNEMTNILTDIYLYKQSPSSLPLSNETAFETYVSIFKKHKTSKEVFQNSFAYYYADVDIMQHIYDDVIDNLKDKLTKEQLKELKEEEKTEKTEK